MADDGGDFGGDVFGNYNDWVGDWNGPVSDPNSPLFGGPGWIHPTDANSGGNPGGPASSGGMNVNDFMSQLGFGNPPQQQNNTNAPSSASPNWGGYPSSGSSPMSNNQPQFPQPNPRGTAPTPAYSSSAGFPLLPAPNLGRPDSTIYNRLQDVLSNPQALQNDPIFKFLMDTGMKGFNRTAAAKGMRLSGNTLIGGTDYSQGLAAKYFQDLISKTLLPGSEEELKRWSTPAQLEVQKYGASHGSFGNNTGANPGTQAEFASGDLIPYIQSLLSSSSRGGVGLSAPTIPVGPGFGGRTMSMNDFQPMAA